MRRYPLTWVFVLLLVAAGILFWLRQGHSLKNGGSAGPQSAQSQSSSTTAASASAAAAKSAAASAVTNKFAWRLSNTTNSLAQLMHNSHAILLENAFIDTDSKLNLSAIPKKLQAQGDPGAYLVQASGPISSAFRAVLVGAGATIVSYIPNNTFLVRASEAVANALAANPLVQAVIPYEPYYKVQSPLLSMADQSLPPQVQLNLGLFPNDAADTLQQIQKLGGIILSEENSAAGYTIVKVEPPSNWTAIAGLPGVHIIEPYYRRALANDLARPTMKITADSITSSNYMNLTGKNVIVEVNDAGIDTNHIDFGRGAGNPSRVFYHDPAMGVDTSGHGTHVAGIIAGDGHGSMFVTNAYGSELGSSPTLPGTNGQFRGKAPMAQMLSMNYGDSDQDLQAAAAETNILISNNSWGNGDQDYDLEAANYDAATRDALPFVTGSQPVLFVFAAGDAGTSADSIESPGTAKDVITVGALEELRFITNSINITNVVTNSTNGMTTNVVVSQPWLGDTEDSNSVFRLSSDGNVGIGTEGTYGRFKPDVVAPGTFVVSCRSEQWDTNAYYHPTNNTYYDFPDLIPTNSVSDSAFDFAVPANMVDVIFYVVTNLSSPPTLPPIPIYLQTNSANPYDYMGSNYVVVAPTSQTPLDVDWSVEASNVTMSPLAYDLIVDVQTTNWNEDYYSVSVPPGLERLGLPALLQGMNDSLSDPAHLYYRYESGTSMSAPAVSGFLALIQDYFTNQFEPRFIPSPALLKAMTIDGARTTPGYTVQVTTPPNDEGWGLPNMSNSIPAGITNKTGLVYCSTFIRDQASAQFSPPFGASPTQAGPTPTGNFGALGLATGDKETFYVQLNTNTLPIPGNYLPLHATLAWTDPPGDPSAAIKLVNSLELVVTDMDNPNIVYYGNDIGSLGYNNRENASNAPPVDAINNVQKVIIAPYSTNRVPDSHYSVTVIGNRVNVNAVSQDPNDVVQDFALVISSGDNDVTSNAITYVDDNGIVSNPTGDQNITGAQTNTILLNQIVGANTPLLGTNIVDFTPNTVAYSTNGQFTIGMTNQWHFYIVTNLTTFTNAAFITFGASTLSIPRMGAFANSLENSTTPGADLDMLVTRSTTDQNASNLLHLDPVEVSNCVNGVDGDGSSLVSGGTDFVAYTNVPQNEVYYIGIKSESQMAVEYDFIPIFTDVPFGSLDQNGDELISGLNVPSPIPDGTPTHPGISYVFYLALYPITLQNVVVTNVILHQNFGDLVGSLSHSGTSVVLNNHDSITNPAPPGPYTLVYSGNTSQYPGSVAADGPGNMQSFDGLSGQGIWQMTQEGTALGQTGLVESTSMFLQKYQDPTKGIFVTVQPGQWFYTYLGVPNGFTNLELYGSVTNSGITGAAMQMYLNTGGDPTFTDYLLETNLTNPPPAPAPFPTFAGDWALLSYGPPLQADTYYIGLYNPNTVAQTVYLFALLNGPGTPAQPSLFTSTNVVPIINDAVTSSTNTQIVMTNTDRISSMNVGFVVQYPRISDLAFTLISPEGQRILLMENRGGPTATNAGGVFYVTNSIGTTTANGTAAPTTNSYNLNNNSGTISFFFNAFTIPDQLTVYYGNDPTTFTTNLPNPDLLFNSQMMSGTTNVSVSFGPGPSTYITFIVNQFGNTNGGGDAWTYTINGTFASYNYLTFTDNTNLTVTPIKFAIPPFDMGGQGTNYTFGNFDLATNGDYFALTNIYDSFGGWTVPTNLVTQVTNGVVFTNNYNEVSVIPDPGVAFQSNTNSSNFLALGYGLIVRTNFIDPNHLVTISYQYRGPGIAGWWRGEGDAHDSSDAEQHGQNGSLIGRYTFPAGEVSQAFSMENNGQLYDFAGTNGYVQIRQQPFLVEVVTNGGGTNESGSPVTLQSSYLDVGTGPGLTVEGWINPTNLANQMPLVEWLARVPTNGSDTNLTIRAGPFLDRGTDHYYYLLGPTNWTTSETWAQELGGHLVTLDSADEQNWVFDTFAGYGGKNRNLWIGLTNYLNNNANNFAYSSGLTNVTYTNWLFLQPTNCGDATRNYAFMFGVTNQYAGLWALADTNGIMCGPVTNIIYGVVEVTNLQTNGVQFWISVTNVPGTTNLIMTNTGCLFANLVDITNGSHWIYSGPNLIQSNVFQHVALTYDTNSGTAMLFYDGTNVATTNWGINIIPKTTGDVLLGKDMSLETNNYFGGLMDEMSIYNRALSDSEIAAIYSVSAYTTNRLIGKFDPAVTPPLGLAEAQVVLGNMTNTILGENNTWQQGSVTFLAQTNQLPIQIRGIQPGMLFDSFAVNEAPLGNLYYLPEQALDEVKDQRANGVWTLEIWDTRNNVLATSANLLSWQLQFNLESNTPPPVSIGDQEPTSITIPPGQTVTVAVPVPVWATVATNILDSSTEPLNVYFNGTTPPVGSQPPDTYMFSGTFGSETLTTNIIITTTPTNITPNQTYYIGLQNNGAHAASAVFEVDFNIMGLTNDVPYNDTLATNDSYRYFSFDVTSTNAYEATFQLLRMNGNADLVVSKGVLPTLTSADYGSFNSGNANETIYVLTNSMPVPLSVGRWYLGVFNRDTHAVNYTVLAQELDLNPPLSTTTNTLTLIQLTNGVPFDYTAGPGADLTNFFYFNVTNSVVITNGVLVTNYVGSIHFELYNLTGNGDLTVQTNAPPFAPPFFQSSAEPGTTPEFIEIHTNSALTNLQATWYLGVPNQTTNLIHFTIFAVIDTNNVFPAFPGAEGAGAGALGASFRNGSTNNTVYHVTSLDDSGPGTLRDAVSSTNRTIIFDTSGVIYLQTPLVVTNSDLSILGQTAPEGGITVAGASTIISTNVHDVVLRYLRFRPTYSGQYMYADGGNFIYKFTPDGQQSTFANLTQSADGMVCDPNGNLFVAQLGNILEFTPAGVQSTFTTAAGSATFLTFDRFGNLFQADHNGNIFEYTPAGVQSTFATGLSEPQGLVFNSSGDLISAGFSYINEYTPGGAQFSFTTSVNNPIGIALNSAGDLFESDLGSDSILEFGPTGTPATYASGIANLTGINFNNAGDLFVGGNNNIIEFTPNGTQTTFATIAGGVATVAFSPPVPGLTTGLGGDALQFNSVSNVIADHISAMWSSNNDVSILNCSNVTVQWSILSDSLSSQPPANGALVRYGAGTVSLHHNLFADNYTGSPRLGDNISLDFVNNVIYNWVTNAGYSTADDITNNLAGFTNCLNFVCNYLIAGPNTITTNIAFWGGTNTTYLFQTNNFIDCDQNGVLNGADTEWNMFTNWNGLTNLYTATNQFRLPPVSVDEAYQAYERVLDFAGVSMFKREPAETNIVENVRNQIGGIITAPGLVPTLTTNFIFQYNAQDGIPDFWKTTYAQVVTNQYNNYPLDNSGYSELEEFDNWLAGPHAVTTTNTPVGVDLQKLFGKTGDLSFWATNAIHGIVYLTNVLGAYTNQGQFSNSIAIFTPTNGAVGGTNYFGYASFDVIVTNNNTFGYFGPVTVSVFVSAHPATYSEQAGYLPLYLPLTNSVPPYTTIWYLVSVPTNAVQATNALLSAGAPLNLLYSSNQPPTTAYPSDAVLLNDSTNGSAVINTSGAPLPPELVPGNQYFLGVQNTNNFATNYAVQVTFDEVALPPVVIIIPPGQPVTNVIPGASSPGAAIPGGSPAGGGSNPNPVYYGVLVPPNAVTATNTFVSVTGNGTASLYFNQNALPLTGAAGDYELIANYNGTTPISAVLYTNGVPPPLIPNEVYYIAITNSAGPGTTVTDVFEYTFGYSYSPPILPSVTNITIVAGNTLNVNDQASDTNYGTLFYYLSTAPPETNAVISGTGQITWAVPTNTPGENVLFTTVVSNSYTMMTATNAFTVTVIPLSTPTQPPQTNSIPTNTVNWLAVPVPVDAEWATNILLFSTNLPVNVLFTTNFPPTVNGAYTLMFDETNGTSILGTGTVPTNIVPGSVYYLGVQDTNNTPVNYAIKVNFGYYSPPVLPAISNQVIFAGTTLTVTNTATDTNGVGQLFYTLTTAPPVDATISTAGVITWATTTNQAPGDYVFTTIVTNSVTTLSDTNTFTVTIISPAIGSQPQTNTVSANSVNWMQVNVPATAEWATNILRFARNLPVNVLYTTNLPPLTNNASVLMLNQRSGTSVLFTNLATAPTNLVPGGTYYLGVQNTNNTAVTYAIQVIFGYPQQYTFPVSIVYTNIGGTNGFLLTWYAPTNDYFRVQETPVLYLPPVWSAFNNIIAYAGPVTSGDGLFSFFDNGVEYPFGPTRFYRLQLLQPNGLYLPNQTNYVLSVSQLLTVTNTAFDSDTNASLIYNLMDFPTPATNALINTNGVITWTPGPADGGNAFTFTTIVTDNGLPPATATNAFTVFVLPAPVITSATATPSSVTLQWSASKNDVFGVEWTTNLVSGNWTLMSPTVSSTTGAFTFTDSTSQAAAKFYRLVWLPPL